MSIKNKLLIMTLFMIFATILVGCRLKIDDVTIKCNELTGKCTMTQSDGDEDDEDPSSSRQGGGDTSPSDYAELLVNTASKYVGYTRNDFKPIASKQGFTIKDNSSWCAMFVSTIILEAEISSLEKYTSASVSTFMSRMISDNRFYHSQYWYNKSGNYKDPKGPQVGDIVFFAQSTCPYTGNGKLPGKTDDCYRHIGIVKKVTSSSITYIHGNTSNCKGNKGVNSVCGNTTEPISSQYIIGYGR